MPTDRFKNVLAVSIEARSIEADSLKVAGHPVTPGRPSESGVATVTGLVEIQTGLEEIGNVQCTLGTMPPGPGYGVVVCVAKTKFSIQVYKPAPNGLGVVPATVPFEIHWEAKGK